VNQSKVIAVHGELFFTRASPWQNVAGYRYTAECEDLSSEVILSDTFVRYDRAYQWRKSLPSSGHMTPLAARFTFGGGEGDASSSGAMTEFHVKW